MPFSDLNEVFIVCVWTVLPNTLVPHPYLHEQLLEKKHFYYVCAISFPVSCEVFPTPKFPVEDKLLRELFCMSYRFSSVLCGVCFCELEVLSGT